MRASDQFIGEHDCDEEDCRSCHNCGASGVPIDSTWNLCMECDLIEDVDEEEDEGCCQPWLLPAVWYEPGGCCTRDGKPL